jgi:hypothetical protein
MGNHKTLDLIVGIFWALFAVYGLVGFLPAMQRLQHRWESKRKGPGSQIAPVYPLRRCVFVLLCLLAASMVLAGAFGRDLGVMIGVSDRHIWFLLMILAVLGVLLGNRDRRIWRKKVQNDQ